MSARDQGLPKAQRLKGSKRISELFKSGQYITVFPFRLLYMPVEFSKSDTAGNLFGISVPKRRFRKAVERNHIKRLIREAYRLNKINLPSDKSTIFQNYALMYIYIGKENPDLKFLIKRIRKLHSGLIAKITRDKS